jgi:hypothetical protein
MNTPTGTARSAYLRSVSSTLTDVALTITPDKVATGGGLQFSAAGRSVTGGGEYRAKLVLRNDARAHISLVRNSATGAETTIRSAVLVPGLTYAAGTPVRVRVQVNGVSPTTIRARAWSDGTPEPANWTVSATDSTAALQVPGSLGLVTYLSSSATNGPLTLAVDDLIAVQP